MKNFITKDSGKRIQFSTGFVRDTQEDKPRYDLIYIAMLTRLAELHSRGILKYGERNWEKAKTHKELNRFKASAFRHFIQWFEEVEDGEDHAAAILFNVNAVEFIKQKLNKNGK